MKNLIKLRSLDVSNNRLVFFSDDLGSSPVLEILDLHCNKLQTIPDDLFAKCKRYVIIACAHN